MSGSCYKDDDNEKRQTMNLSQTEYIRKRNSEHPTNSEHAKKSKPAATTTEMNVRIYLENTFRQIHELSRSELEKMTMGSLCKLIDEHVNAEEVVRKLNEKKLEVASLELKYSNLETQINQISGTLSTIQEKFKDVEAQINQIIGAENNVLRTFDRTTPNPSAVPISAALQVERDDVPVNIVASTGEIVSSNEVISTTASAQVQDKPIAQENTASTVEATSEIADKPKQPQKIVIQQIVQRRHPAPLPVLPIIYFIEPASKLMAPAPQVKIHLRHDQVALTWSMLEQDLSAYEEIFCYQVYCYQETSAPPSTDNWKKLVELTALPLPMSCLLATCTSGKYYFAVRGIDVQWRVGPFSSPVPIIFQDVSSQQFKRVISY